MDFGQKFLMERVHNSHIYHRDEPIHVKEIQLTTLKGYVFLMVN